MFLAHQCNILWSFRAVKFFRKELFFFLVHLSLLGRATAPDRQLKLALLIKQRYFGDEELWRASVPLRDVSNKQEEILKYVVVLILHLIMINYNSFSRIYYDTGVEKQLPALRAALLPLRQDRAVRASLDPEFVTFLKSPRLHPASPLQQCLLSLL